MSTATPFNALGGFSVGIPPEVVIDSTGNVVNNVNAPNSNVTANRVFANAYLYANGAPLSIGAAGANTQVQYNNAGLLGASSAFTFNSATSLLSVSKIQVGTNANLGNVANVVILGGTNGYFLQTDGAGNLTWAPASNGGNTGNGVPGGANTQVQFNDAGQFGGDAGFTYNKTSNTLSVTSNITAGNNITGVNLSASNANVTNTLVVSQIDAGNITITGNITNANWVHSSYFLGNGHNLFGLVGANVVGEVGFANVANNVAGANVTGAVALADVANSVAGANVSGQVGNALVAGSVYNSTQANITSVGNLTSLTVIGNTTLGNQTVSNYFIGNLFGVANLARNVTLSAQPNITSVGTLTSLTVTGTTTLGNSVTANNFVGNLLGRANTANLANVANLATVANTANLANAATLAGTVTVNAQPNITSVGTLTSLTVAGNISAGNVNGGNLVSANFLSGTLTTATQSNITTVGTLSNLNVNGNIVAVNINANTGVLSGNGSGLFAINGANVTGIVANALNAVNATTANTASTVTTAAQPNITSVGTLSSLNVSGNISANNFVGNFVGNIANANYSAFAGEVVDSSQPNITSVGTLTSLNVAGSINAGSVNSTFIGNGASLSNIPGANVTGTVANATYAISAGTANSASSATSATTAGTVTTNAQPNITSVGTLSNLQVTGTVTSANLAGTLVTPAQNNITSVGTLTSLAVTGNASAGNVNAGNRLTANFVSGTLTTNAQPNINYLGNIGWLNVDTAVPNSNGNIRFNGSISGDGLASNITITGNLNAGNFVQANLLIGTLTTGSQPNITSIGNLTTLTVTGTANLGNVANVKISGGNANYVLSTDGSGNLSWVEQASSNVTVPGGLNTYIQFNDNGAFGGDNTLTWNKSTDILFVGGNVNVASIVTAQIFNSNVATGTAPFQVLSTTPVANLGVQTAATVRSNAQPNITSVGTLTGLTVSGNINTTNLDVVNTFNAGNITTPGTIGTTNLNVTGNGNISGNTVVSGSGTLSINGKFNSAGSSNVNLGNISNIHISGGINGYVLATDGNANLYWTAGGGGGGNGNPGGSNTQIQYNNGGTFGGSSAFTFNQATNNVQIAGNLISNAFVMGSGIYEFSHSNVFFATTSDTSTTTLLSIDASDIAAVDYTIISTDGVIRNFIKISAVLCSGTLNYVEYSTIPVNGYTGDFVVAYDAGNIVSPPSIQLQLTPQSGNLMTHKMSVTTYKE